MESVQSDLGKIIIANASPFFRNERGAWIPASEWKSLQQWWCFLDGVALAKPEINQESLPVGWVLVPEDIEVFRLCGYQNSRLSRRRETLLSAQELLCNASTLILRVPNYESKWCFQVAARLGVSLILEIHGDWESAVLEEDSKSLPRKVTKTIRARSNRNVVSRMAEYATSVVGIGPELLKKYVPHDTPSLISTNHLLREADYRRRNCFDLKIPPRLLFVGDIQRRKGLHILFEALTALKRLGRNFKMTLVGAGPMKDELAAYSLAHGFSDSVEFVGTVAHGGLLYKYFQESDIFILPSIAAEGVPRVTHEAMAFGCPVIAADIGSVSWQLDGDAGIIIKPGSVDSLLEAIVRVLDDAKLRENLSSRGYAKSLEYTLEKQQEKISSFVSNYIMR